MAQRKCNILQKHPLIELFLLLSLQLYSCSEDTSYQMQLVIENKTDSNISIKLFPKNQYLHNDLYKFCDFGSGYRATTIGLEENCEIEIYISSDLNIEPYLKATVVFDSIHVSGIEGEVNEIKFSTDMVIGYEENLFSEESIWEMKTRKYDLQTSLQKNPVESNDYIFSISKEKITL